MSMVKTSAITGGVDTRADTHVAAALDGIGGLQHGRLPHVAGAARARPPAQFLDDQLSRLDELIVALVTARAPGLACDCGLEDVEIPRYQRLQAPRERQPTC